VRNVRKEHGERAATYIQVYFDRSDGNVHIGITQGLAGEIVLHMAADMNLPQFDVHLSLAQLRMLHDAAGQAIAATEMTPMKEVRVNASCPVCDGDIAVIVELDRDKRGMRSAYSHMERACGCVIPDGDWWGMIGAAEWQAEVVL